jgi:hypothetical protein
MFSVIDPAPDAVSLAMSPYVTSLGAEYFESLIIYITTVSETLCRVQPIKKA